jgi:DNA-binding transcriptional regulator YhcF (GntR family)
MWSGEEKTIESGQLLTGRKEIAKKTGIAETTVERILNHFEKYGQIGQQKTSKYRLITIRKWGEYQIVDNKRTTDGQQTDTFKKNKNVKNIIGDKSQEDMSFKNMRRYKGEEGGYEEVALQTDPDYKPKGEKKGKSVSEDIQAVFDLFNNPASALWRMREIERVAAQTLFDTYGLEKLKIRVQRIQAEAKKKDPLFPHITTPSQLLDKMPNVERYLNV